MNFPKHQCPHLNYNYSGYRNDVNETNKPRRAVAHIFGGPLAPRIRGTVIFTEAPGGTKVSVEVNGLPQFKPASEGSPQVGPHGFHIHENGNCTVGNPSDPFMSAGGHWNPTNQPHGNHAGDFPVLFSNDGYSRIIFFTNKFTVSQIVGKSVVIHQGPDDYKTQPAGASGKKLACGVIQLEA
ncbi:superoxide dismutase family protein [Clostridium cylindrosporum]|uniref:Superoxide dismutase n=1 Tax=Clostridium cylindrosporum DSM 605 TaxID=1121307 RepID=A0A0J8FZP0_CLOCY|nr:superoxide dismutase family protein [Clostridium cylindrosporum]KMT21026.1 superoxide dismutase [Clostridium cylindrosporum DSM 605]